MKEDFEKIEKFLDQNKINYEVFEHEKIHSAEEGAKIRNVDLKFGAKAMIVRSKGNFFQFVLRGDMKIEWKKVKNILGNTGSLASPEEVLKVTNCGIGSVSPFGNLYSLKVYLDNKILENECFYFSAGLHDKSIKIKTKDYIKIVNPEILEFSLTKF